MDILSVMHMLKKADIPDNDKHMLCAHLVNALYESHAYGVILSAYYRYGQISAYETTTLLRGMFSVGDYAGFLKQVYRFGLYSAFTREVSEAIAWHDTRGFRDGAAWRRKFSDAQLRIGSTHEQSLSPRSDTPASNKQQ
jgi:hypothetical protein